MSSSRYSKDNIQFVIDALEQGWSVRKDGKFYELSNDTQSDHLKVPSLDNAKSLNALFEDVRSTENVSLNSIQDDPGRDENAVAR